MKNQEYNYMLTDGIDVVSLKSSKDEIINDAIRRHNDDLPNDELVIYTFTKKEMVNFDIKLDEIKLQA